ncbi:Uncharacterized protein HSEST_3136 (plasmid) [Halapricum desulfuricans]|uniref:Uncharacterized protein n=1 Tax=Halapricum desulfuricans TaxID=2841257 RepID=A0A897NPF9_9EURY|nr:Uncharacterized protein HSEST_3136 [Halapricum desulfuricans]
MLFAAVLVNTRRQPMSYQPSTSPANLPTNIVDTLNGYNQEQRQHVARYPEE